MARDEVASWAGGGLTVQDLIRYTRTLTGSDARRVLGGGQGARASVLGAATESALAGLASGLDLAGTEGFVAATMDEWRLQAQGWAGLLGLVTSGSAEGIRAVSLGALAATGQNATVAREALSRERGPLLRTLYEIETAIPSGT